jgi:hypothetical protein
MRIALLALAALAAAPDGGTAPDAGAPAARCPASTPLDAIARLEQALRAGDQGEAVACKDFRWEARLVLEKLKGPGEQVTGAMIDETAELLETAFRREIQTGGFEEMLKARCQSKVGPKLGADLVLVFQSCHRPDGSDFQQEIQVGRGREGWRVLLPMR